MTTNHHTYDLTQLARRARHLKHWVWVDGMRWFRPLPDDFSGFVFRGIVGANEPVADAVPDLTCNDTIAAIADRVRYLYELPDLECVYEDHSRLYKVFLPSGVAVARYSPAGAWVGLLELWSYRAEIKNIGRAS
jgi:hypothetical protein